LIYTYKYISIKTDVNKYVANGDFPDAGLNLQFLHFLPQLVGFFLFTSSLFKAAKS